MTDDDRWIPPDEWAKIVANVPLVSVDLIVKHEGGVLLGLRENEPAKGEWFVSGGTVLKNERLSGAVQRVVRAEMGCEVDILDELGAFEHFYETSEVEGVDTKQHAYMVEHEGECRRHRRPALGGPDVSPAVRRPTSLRRPVPRTRTVDRRVTDRRPTPGTAPTRITHPTHVR
jgi:colanic acid biosynthesis protein WcaH